MKARYYTKIEAANILEVSIDTIKRMLNDGRLNGSRLVGNRRLIPAAEVEKYLVPADQIQN